MWIEVGTQQISTVARIFGEVWEKYCPVANQIVHVNSYWDCTEKEISCLIKNDMVNVANCPEEDCTTECLEE